MATKISSTVLRQRLLDRRDRLRQALDRVHGALRSQRERLGAGDPCGWLDCTAEAEAERDPTLRAAVIMAAELQSVERALGRVDAMQRWDRCVGCGEAIEQERLELLPHTSYCGGCA